MAFKDAAHTKDRVRVGLEQNPAGSCKGPLTAPCSTTDLLRQNWCSWCKAKNPIN